MQRVNKADINRERSADGGPIFLAPFDPDKQQTVISRLAENIDDTQTTIKLYSAGLLPATGTIQIGDEQISYTGKTANELTGCTRAANTTTAASHNGNAVVVLVGGAQPHYEPSEYMPIGYCTADGVENNLVGNEEDIETERGVIGKKFKGYEDKTLSSELMQTTLHEAAMMLGRDVKAIEDGMGIDWSVEKNKEYAMYAYYKTYDNDGNAIYEHFTVHKISVKEQLSWTLSKNTSRRLPFEAEAIEEPGCNFMIDNFFDLRSEEALV